MLPSHQTSIAALPDDLRSAIHVAASEAQNTLLRGHQSFATSVMFSWYENGELLTCRVTVRGELPREDHISPMVTVAVIINDEYSRRNLITAMAFQRCHFVLSALAGGMVEMTEVDEATIWLPLDRLLTATASV